MDSREDLRAQLRALLSTCEANPEPGDQTSVDHLAWMCRTALGKVGAHPDDKLWRWAGFAHGCLACKGLVQGPPAAPAGGEGGSELLLAAHRSLFERYLAVCEANPEAGGGSAGAALAPLCRAGLDGLGSAPVAAHSLALGFVQGTLAYLGLVGVDAERDFSRPLFHAAYAEAGPVPETLEPGA